MTVKKIFLIITSVLLALSLGSCGTQDTAAKNSDNISNTAKITQNNEENTVSAPTATIKGSDKKTLVVYFSATGNTKQAAEYIGEKTNADLVELVPVNPYSDGDLDWTDENSRVVREHDNPDERNVKLKNASVENFDEYDTVFIGYPIWWGIAAWPVDDFIKTNDFTGKTVIPFCTSASSDLGDSAKFLKDAAKTGDWLDGMRFSSGVTEDEIAQWVKTLGY